MHKVKFYINLISCIFFPLTVFAQKPVKPIGKSECFMMIGKRECPIYDARKGEKESELIIPKAELIELDSLTCNCNYRIIEFAISYSPTVMDAYEQFKSNKFTEHYKKIIKSSICKESMYIAEIKAIKKDTKDSIHFYPIRIIIDSAYNVAYLRNKITNTFCYGIGNKMNLSGFKKIDTLFVSSNITKDRNLVVKSFNVEVTTKNEKKVFNVTGDIVPDEIKTYIFSTRRERRKIFIKDVISSNPDNSNRQEIKGLEIIIEN